MLNNNLLHVYAADRRTPRRRLATLVALTALSLSACVGESNGSSSGGSEGGAGGTDVTAGTGGSISQSSSQSGPSSASSGVGVGVGGGDGEGGGTPSHPFDHCVEGYRPHPTDSSPEMKDGPADFFPPGNNDPNIVDTTVQPEVLKWMYDHSWQDAHVEWHAIRGCSVPGGGGLSRVNICSFTQLVPEDQNCQTPGDGYQFLVFHRHMIQALKQLWPNHSEQFTGFPKFPTSAADVPPQWRSAWKDWDAAALQAGKIGDEIDKPENLARFPDEGTLGFWLQCNVGQMLRGATNMPWVGLHFVLHAKWARPGNTTHGVNNTSANIDNYMFWKLHGWIDNVWEKYRLAKGLLPTDQKLKDDLVAQCREMDTEIKIIQEKLDPGDVPDPNEPLPVESGFFHERVRPILESATNLCTGCHAEVGANAKLTLGGHVSSRKIVDGLVNKPSTGGGQYKLVVPGDPDHSWLYLKASGRAETAGCQQSSTALCITGVMPPSTGGPTVSPAQLEVLRQWILDGAEGPP
ncbi:hypothetical protein BE17_38650 [Sorangium cellulosum]|uniref:Cytochrome c domain-containing protein n=1 Tax=Sorangium cellulosum TaxID=56 RepID=A0A150RRU4_SORCE|nr:hypothetical protein BE17_38650 [Sorangium cellulosum]